jgi:hypothetical protein
VIDPHALEGEVAAAVPPPRPQFARIFATDSLRVLRGADADGRRVIRLEQTQGELFLGEANVVFPESEVEDLVRELGAAIAPTAFTSPAGGRDRQRRAPPAASPRRDGEPNAIAQLIEAVVEGRLEAERRSIAAALELQRGRCALTASGRGTTTLEEYLGGLGELAATLWEGKPLEPPGGPA